MKKRRTRKQKETAKHTFTVKWDPGFSALKNEPKNIKTEANVKGQFSQELAKATSPSLKEKKSVILAKSDYLKRIKKDIARSLAMAALIIGVELVIYLALKV